MIGRGFVEIACRFVAYQKVGGLNESLCNRDALLLSAGKLCGSVIDPFGKPNVRDQRLARVTILEGATSVGSRRSPAPNIGAAGNDPETQIRFQNCENLREWRDSARKRSSPREYSSAGRDLKATEDVEKSALPVPERTMIAAASPGASEKLTLERMSVRLRRGVLFQGCQLQALTLNYHQGAKYSFHSFPRLCPENHLAEDRPLLSSIYFVQKQKVEGVIWRRGSPAPDDPIRNCTTRDVAALSQPLTCLQCPERAAF